jgi:DNA-binding PadR family transcriptional regulator
MALAPDSPRDLYVLGMLSRGQTYGPELMKAVRVSRADRWVSLSEKHAYYILRKFARIGWVTAVEERDESPIPRTVYELTPAGRAALAKLLRSTGLQEAIVPNPFDAVFGMLAYSDVLGRDDALRVLRARRDVLQRRLAEDALPKAAHRAIESQYGYLARSLYEKVQTLLGAELEWLDGVIRHVEHNEWERLRVPRKYLENNGADGGPRPRAKALGTRAVRRQREGGRT